MAAKQYEIYCITKANCHEYLHGMTVDAANVKEAKGLAKRAIRETYDRHAFSVSTKPDGDWNWEVYCERNGLSMDEVKRQAFEDGGFEIR